MRDYAIGALFLAVCILGAALYLQTREIKDIDGKLSNRETKSDAHALDLQTQCEKQAQDVFREWKRDPIAGFGPMAEFEDHFNPRLGRCFVVISNMTVKDNVVSNSKSLLDAFERKELGSYIWINAEKKKFWEVSPTECDVTLPSGERKECTSSDQFDELVKTYME